MFFISFCQVPPWVTVYRSRKQERIIQNVFLHHVCICQSKLFGFLLVWKQHKFWSCHVLHALLWSGNSCSRQRSAGRRKSMCQLKVESVGIDLPLIGDFSSVLVDLNERSAGQAAIKRSCMYLSRVLHVLSSDRFFFPQIEIDYVNVAIVFQNSSVCRFAKTLLNFYMAVHRMLCAENLGKRLKVRAFTRYHLRDFDPLEQGWKICQKIGRETLGPCEKGCFEPKNFYFLLLSLSFSLSVSFRLHSIIWKGANQRWSCLNQAEPMFFWFFWFWSNFSALYTFLTLWFFLSQNQLLQKMESSRLCVSDFSHTPKWLKIRTGCRSPLHSSPFRGSYPACYCSIATSTRLSWNRIPLWLGYPKRSDDRYSATRTIPSCYFSWHFLTNYMCTFPN